MKKFLTDVADLFIFTANFFVKFFRPPYEISEISRHILVLGLNSLFLISTSALIIGMVMSIQLTPTLEQFGAETLIPNMVAISIIREIGPVLTALVCAGKLGSAIGAEIGSMKVSEQIDAMAVTGVDHYSFLVVTRVVATTVAVPILTIYSVAISLLGSFIAINLTSSISLNLFFSRAFEYMHLYDVIPSIFKSLLFGFTIGIVGCFYGYNTTKGTAGVGKAAHTSVVSASLLIFFIDMLAAEISHLIIP
ncbi:MAG TPA: ABC transporter permease [Cytophagaceae bacterium]